MKFSDEEIDPVIDELAAKERAAYHNLKDAEEAHKKAKFALCEEIKVRGVTWVPWGDQKITVVEAERVRVDEKLLKERVDAETWESITKTSVVIEEARKAALAGHIDGQTLNDAFTVSRNSPFAKFSDLTAEDLDEQNG
jgi:hypothetical protein